MPFAGHFEAWREAFSNKVREPFYAAPLKTASLAEDMRQWTSTLTTVVVKACEAHGWAASAKWNPSQRLPKPGKEFLNIDVTALPAGTEPLWPMPLAVFELENSRSDRFVAYALWKVLCVRAELRVVFAYRPDWEQSRRLIARLTEDVIGGFGPKEREALNGQTVLIIGNRGEGESFPWGYFKCWLLDTNIGRFDKV